MIWFDAYKGMLKEASNQRKNVILLIGENRFINLREFVLYEKVYVRL